MSKNHQPQPYGTSSAYWQTSWHVHSSLSNTQEQSSQSAATLPQNSVTWLESSELEADPAQGLCIHHLFEAQVQRTPDAIAVTFQGRSLTYEELNCRANQLAHYLRKLGVVSETLVAVSMTRSLEMVVSFLGVLKAGGAYLPIDPTYPYERQAYMLSDSQASIILTQKDLLPSLPKHVAQALCVDTDWDVITRTTSSRNLPSLVTPENLAYVIYTSGSTGQPKGVLITHQGVVNHSTAIVEYFGLQPGDRVLQCSSISFDIIVEELFPSLISGARVVLRTDEMISSTRNFLQFVEQEQITILNLPTAFWHEWVNGLLLLKESIPASVRLVIVGGEKVSRSLYTQWVEKFGHYPRWLNTYGPTETTVTATIYDPVAEKFDSNLAEIPIGRPIAGTEAYVLDEELQPVAVGVPGELHIGGAGLARGYLNLPEPTAKKFIPNPFKNEPGARLYKTGDKVRWLPNGNLEYIGRIDFQVKIRGFRIELSEIEYHLEQHPLIQQAIVLAREDVPGDKYLVGYFALQPESTLNPGEIRAFLQQKLPEYMVPHAFVEVDTFPLTPNGKVDRRALPAPKVVDRSDAKVAVASSNPTEAKLLQIWEDILGIQNIRITDNFFDLGGHSLLVARLLDRVAVEFDLNLPLSTLIYAPTIEQLAAVLANPNQMESLMLIRPGGAKEPIFFIHDGDGETMLYRTLAYHLDPERPIYGIRPYADAHRPILHTRIEDMAAYYVEKIRTVQPEGPYWFAGMCAGGVISYEMARQLQAQGQQVAMVALLDAAEPTAQIRSGLITSQRMGRLSEDLRAQSTKNLWVWLLRSFLMVGQKVWNTISYEVSTMMQRQIDSIKLQLFRYWLDHQWTPPRSISPVSVRKTYIFAEADYHPTTPLSGEVVLFCATEGEGNDQPYREIYADPMLGWKSRTTDGVCVYTVPGGHSSMLQEPHVQVLAELMQTHIDRVASSLNSERMNLIESH